MKRTGEVSRMHAPTCTITHRFICHRRSYKLVDGKKRRKAFVALHVIDAGANVSIMGLDEAAWCIERSRRFSADRDHILRGSFNPSQMQGPLAQ